MLQSTVEALDHAAQSIRYGPANRRGHDREQGVSQNPGVSLHGGANCFLHRWRHRVAQLPVARGGQGESLGQHLTQVLDTGLGILNSFFQAVEAPTLVSDNELTQFGQLSVGLL